MGNEIVEMEVEEPDVRPNMNRNSQTHHEELVTSTSRAEESDAVVEWFGRWNTAINSSENKKVISNASREANIDLPNSVDVLMCWFEVKKI